MGKKISHLAEHLLRVAVGLLFLAAGIMKIWDFHAGEWASPQFALDIQHYDLVSWVVPIAGSKFSIPILVAIYLPWVEVMAGAALLLPRWRSGALLLCGLMTIAFLGALASAWARGLDISCGCFGKDGGTHDIPLRIAQDVMLLAVILFLAWRARRTPIADPVLT